MKTRYRLSRRQKSTRAHQTSDTMHQPNRIDPQFHDDTPPDTCLHHRFVSETLSEADKRALALFGASQPSKSPSQTRSTSPQNQIGRRTRPISRTGTPREDNNMSSDWQNSALSRYGVN